MLAVAMHGAVLLVAEAEAEEPVAVRLVVLETQERHRAHVAAAS